MRYQTNLQEPHMMTMKNIFKYFCITTSLGLWYMSNESFFVQSYSNTDLGVCGLDRKNTIGCC